MVLVAGDLFIAPAEVYRIQYPDISAAAGSWHAALRD